MKGKHWSLCLHLQITHPDNLQTNLHIIANNKGQYSHNNFIYFIKVYIKCKLPLPHSQNLATCIQIVLLSWTNTIYDSKPSKQNIFHHSVNIMGILLLNGNILKEVAIFKNKKNSNQNICANILRK